MSQKFTYTFELDAEIEKLQTKLSAAQKSLAGVMQSGKAPGIEKSITSIEKAIGRLQEKASTPITSEAAFGSLQKESSAIGLKLKELTKQIGGLANLSKSERFELLPADTQKRVSDAAAAISTFTAARDKAAKKSDELLSKERALSKVTKEKGDLEAKIAKNSTIQKTAEESAKAISREIVQLQARQKQLGSEEDALKRVEAARKAAEAAKASGASPAEVSFESGLGDAQRHLDAVREIAAALTDKEQAQKAATATAEKYSKTIQQDQVRLQGLTASYEGLEREVKDLEAAMKSGSSKQQTAAWKELRQAAQDLGVSMDGIPVRRSQKAIDELLSRLNALEEDGYKELEIAMQQYTNEVQEVATANEQASTSIARGNEEFREQKQIMADRDAFVQRIKDFVGLKGAAMLARTALRSAMQSVKELDAAMTEMSVVTDLSVGDYWEQLPEYTERASALGLSIKDAYEAATLFYQQGLKTNEVVAISNETLKMARIAGLSAEDATNKMTAALRGFNMELNETSAQKVSDVYSELAAITASDVNEISTAMTKTASIAANAGMEFETTAAFLSQIIETTRESAETAGTAMKTVIARFQELKKDPAEIGEVDGEIVDANKIETALRSVGVALRDSTGQFRDLDDVFLELSSKWNTLDTNTQRYIATIAAGSRQQSRFIAMMSDYSRTQELVNAANNSAGASNQQFEKTLDSLDAKLNQLKNAWDTFTMGILNNDAIKMGVDILTKILNVINKVTEGFDGFSGSVSKLGFIFAVFKIGRKLVQNFSNHILGVFAQIGKGWKDELNKMQQDTTNAINGIQTASPAKAAQKQNSSVGLDGHYKTFRERVFEPVAHQRAIKGTQASTKKAITNAETGTSLSSMLRSTSVAKGARAGNQLGGYAFNEVFSDKAISQIKQQFETAMKGAGKSVEEVNQIWNKLEANIGDKDAITAIEMIEKELKEASAAAKEITVDGIKDAYKKETKTESLPETTEKVVHANRFSKVKNAARANRAISSNRGGSLVQTIKTEFEKGPKLSFNSVFDTKSLESIRQQFAQKMKEMGKSTEEINQAWEKLETNIGDKEVVSALDMIQAELKQTQSDMKGVNSAAEGVDITLRNNADTAGALGEEMSEQSQANLESVSSAISNVGSAAMGVGMALGTIGSFLRDMGLEEYAEGFEKVGNVIMFIGSALMILPPIISLINTALATPPLGVILIIIGAIIAGLLLITAIITAIQADKNAMANKIKELEEATKQAKETAQAAQEAYDELLEHKQEYDGLKGTLDDLTEGTTAWKEAMEALNEQVMELIALYPELAAFVNFSDNGALSIEAEGWDALVEAQRERASNLAGVAALAGYREYNAKASQYASWTPSSNIVYRDKETNEVVDRDVAAYQNENGVWVITDPEKFSLNIESGPDVITYAFNDDKFTEEGKAALSVMQGLAWGTTEYNEALANLRKQTQATNPALLTEINHFDEMARLYAQNAKVADTYARTLIASSGSAAAQVDENYNRIVESLLQSSETIIATSEGVARNNWNAANQKRDELDDMLSDRGIAASGDYFDQLAALSKAEGAKAYTEEEIQSLRDKGYKQAEKEVMANIQQAKLVDGVGQYVDELYGLQERYSELNDLYSGSLDIDLAEAEKAIAGLEGVSDIAKNALNQQVKIVKQQKDNIDKELQKIYGKKGIIATTFIGSYDNARKFLTMYNDMLASGGEMMAKAFSETFDVLNQEEKIAFLSEYEDVNWSSSIAGAAALKKMLEEGDTRVQHFAMSALELSNNFYSATAQANELYKSLGQETLADLAQDGKIAATELLELAKTNKKLATMLDTTGVSASVLGDYFELIEEGTLDANSATDDFIKVLQKLNRASATIEDSFAFIDTWEPSRSSTEISTAFGEMRDSMLELYNIGAFGDQALLDYIEKFIGADRWKVILEQNDGNIQAAMRQVMEQVKDFGTNFHNVWKDLAKSGEVNGVTINEDGTIKFDFKVINSTEELREQIMAQGWSAEMADALIADAQTFGQNVKEGLKSLDVGSALVEWLTTSVNIVGGKKVVDEKQFQAFISEAGINEEVARTALMNQGIEVKSALTEGKTLEDWVREAILEQIEQDGSMDLGATFALMLELGLDTETAKAELANMANSLTDVPFKINGQDVTESTSIVGAYTYGNVREGNMDALIDAVVDEHVNAVQRKAALEQARVQGEASIAASVSAANAGSYAFAKEWDSIINGITSWIKNATGGLVDLGTINTAGKVQSRVNSQISDSLELMDGYFSQEFAALDLIINGTGVDRDTANNVWEEILANNGVKEPGTGTSYVDPDDITSPTMDDKEGSDYETPYDWLFVLNQDLEDLIRKREKLERKYQKLLENENASFQDIVNAREDMLASIGDERAQQEKIIRDSIAKSNETWNNMPSGLQAWLEFDKKTGEVSVKDGYEDANIDPETREKWDEYIAEMIENEEAIHGAQDSIEDLDDTAEELTKEGRDESSDYFNRIRDALVAERQEEIDALSAINDSVQEAQDALYNQIQKSIDEERQARENEKTEEDISDKEARLAYLRRDTSGANALEIASLEKELAEQKEDYRDSLIDQALTNLQDANAEAAEQREKQIALLEAQLEAYQNSDEIWTDVAAIFSTSMAMIAGGADFSETPMGELLRKHEVDNENLNPYETEDWEKENKTDSSKAAVYYQDNPSSVAPKTEDAQFKPSGYLANDKKIASGALTHVTDKVTQEKYINGGGGVYLKESDAIKDSDGNYLWAKGRAYYGKQFLHGGLADFTGPAWLDGTKSSPELVLNAQDTHNFILLKDILSDILSGTSTLKKQEEGSSKGGDNYYDIEINVDSISEDYDVEQLADKIKSMIYEDSVYRNVNTINLIR